MTATASQIMLLITNPYFVKGYRLERLWYFHGEAELPIDDNYLIENIATYWLSQRVGFLMGVVSGRVLPEEG